MELAGNFLRMEEIIGIKIFEVVALSLPYRAIERGARALGCVRIFSRGEAQRSAIARLSSVEPSSTKMISMFGQVCARAAPSVSASHGAAL
jgi:hypothetical protein